MLFGGGITPASVTVRRGDKALHFAKLIMPAPPGLMTVENTWALHVSEKSGISEGRYGGPGFGWKDFDTSLVKKVILPKHHSASDSYEKIFGWIFK